MYSIGTLPPQPISALCILLLLLLPRNVLLNSSQSRFLLAVLLFGGAKHRGQKAFHTSPFHPRHHRGGTEIQSQAVMSGPSLLSPAVAALPQRLVQLLLLVETYH